MARARRPARGDGSDGVEAQTSGADPLRRLVAALERLPSLGPRSAERIAYHVLGASREEILSLADLLRQVKTGLRPCKDCSYATEGERCRICEDPSRDRSTLCVVEQPKDVLAIEQTGQYRGLYHVLLGRLSPLDGIEPEHLTVDRLLERAAESREVILATNPDLEGDGTALYLAKRLASLGVRVTRIARGMPAGSALEYVHEKILAEALLERRPLDPRGAAGGVARWEAIALLAIFSVCGFLLFTNAGIHVKGWIVGLLAPA